MKRKFFLLMISSSFLLGQAGYVRYDHPVYPFLERVSSLHWIENYDPFELPKTRNEIKDYLSIVKTNRNDLDDVDKNTLDDFLIEFEYDLYNTTEQYVSLFPKGNVSEHISQQEKFLYFHTDTNDVGIFVNAEVRLENLFQNNQNTKKNLTTTLLSFGGSFRAHFLNKFGFFIKATNGTFWGDKSLALTKPNLSYNYKFNLDPLVNSGSNYYDETQGYFIADYDYVKFKIGRDRKVVGYGPVKSILSNTAPPMDYIGLDIKYSFLNFSYFHGKLLGSENIKFDPLQGPIRMITDKYIGYHRLGLNYSKHLTLGLGEIILYSNRGLDLSYLNPFNYYKSAEHLNQDRDNSMLFLDFTNNSVKGLKFYGTLLIDDIDFEKLGTSWYGNQTLLDVSIYSTQLYKIVPIDISLQYIRIDPYVYTHRIYDNNFTSLNRSLGSLLQPNSESFVFGFVYRPNYRFNLALSFQYYVHGANELNADGSIKVNHGGDILAGHRPFDSTEAKLLNGERERKREYLLSFWYEPINNYKFKINLMYVSDTLQNSISNKIFNSSIALTIRI